MKCDNCGRTFQAHEAVAELSNEANSPANVLGQSTKIVRLTLCPQCAADREKTKLWLSYMMIGFAIIMALGLLAMILSLVMPWRF
jgi:hypothetical protein